MPTVRLSVEDSHTDLMEPLVSGISRVVAGLDVWEQYLSKISLIPSTDWAVAGL